MSQQGAFKPKSKPRDLQLDGLKLPPHSIEAEQSVLGGLMLDAEAWDRVAEAVVKDDFYLPFTQDDLLCHAQIGRSGAADRFDHGF